MSEESSVEGYSSYITGNGSVHVHPIDESYGHSFIFSKDPTNGSSSLVLMMDKYAYPTDALSYFVLMMDMYLYPNDGPSSFVLPKDLHSYPIDRSF